LLVGAPHRRRRWNLANAAPSQKSQASTQATASSKSEKIPYGTFGDGTHGIDIKGLTDKPFYRSDKKGRYYYLGRKGERVYIDGKDKDKKKQGQ